VVGCDGLESDRRFEFRWPWLPDGAWETTASVHLERAGYGTLLTLTDGPFDLRVPGVLDAYAEALEGWGEALTWLRGVVDFSSDLRPASTDRQRRPPIRAERAVRAQACRPPRRPAASPLIPADVPALLGQGER